MKHLIPAALLLLAATPAHAAGFTLLLSSGEGAPVYMRALEAEPDGNFTAALDLGETVIAAVPDYEIAHGLQKLEYREMTSWAISLEGPWYQLQDMDTFSPWKSLPASVVSSPTLLASQIKYKEPDIKIDADFMKRAKAGLAKSAPEDVARWSPLLDKCFPVSEGSPCYSYRSQIDLRYTLKDNKQTTLSIYIPGGC